MEANVGQAAHLRADQSGVEEDLCGAESLLVVHLDDAFVIGELVGALLLIEGVARVYSMFVV